MERDARALTKKETEVLGGLMERWAGRTSEMLSQMTAKKVVIGVKDLWFCRLEDVPSKIGNPIDTVYAVYLKVEEENADEDPPFSLLFMYRPENGIKLASLLQGLEDAAGEIREPSEIDISALKEIGNISSGAFVAEVSDTFGIRVTEGLPEFTCDMMQAVLQNPLAEFALNAEYVLLFDIVFEINRHELSANFVVLLDPNFGQGLRTRIEQEKINVQN